MGKIGVPKPVKLIMSLITSDDLLLHQILEVLAQRYGDIDFKSDILPFDQTDYYTAEMGRGLFRRFVTFRPLIPRESLVRIKRETNQIEEAFAAEGRRRINIDPGYICAEHLILATTKGYTHRPYLGEGIYADLTLIYQKGEFRPLQWTYPDYASHQIREILKEIRKRYLQELKGGSR
ncbi:MAG: DUF4416 domain-containing protein [Deltaproteobacteria bacterium]|nr:MAG: DUF4416 domain-containing protein [Deltaproteobacteria bacterium]